ncbi:4Fe-4S cluster-binding domain-containing protein, partial [Vibrio anguillarum]
ANANSIYKLVLRVKEECPDKDIWMWTGYTIDELSSEQRSIIEHVDVLIDGRFEQDKYDPELLWRGSSNQIIHKFNI